MVATFISKAGQIATIKKLLLPISIQQFVCRKSSLSFENLTPNDKSYSTKTMQVRTQLAKQLLDHPLYSADLSPNDFFTFPKIKNGLSGQKFQSPEEAADAFKNVILTVPTNEW